MFPTPYFLSFTDLLGPQLPGRMTGITVGRKAHNPINSEAIASLSRKLEKPRYQEMTSDDLSCNRVLPHTYRGLVISCALSLVPYSSLAFSASSLRNMPDRQRTTRIVRVRTGCWTCRRRKKKCDESRPICGGCLRNDLGCSWPASVPGRSNSIAQDVNDVHDVHDVKRVDERRSSLEVADLDGMQMPASPDSRHSSTSSGGQSVIADKGLDDIMQDMQEEIIDRRTSVGSIDNSLATVPFGNLVPRTMSMLPGYDADSYQLLSHYLSTTADCMANGSTPLNPFLVQIVPLAFSSDLLLQLVITQSAAHRAFRRRDESDAIAHSHYTKAIQLFRHGVTEFIEGKEPNPLMLLVGALLMCFTEVPCHHPTVSCQPTDNRRPPKET